MHFKVSAVLPIDARTFLIERDSAAFRALVARTQNLGALEIREGWSDGDVQVFKLVTQPDIDHFVPKKVQKYLPSNLEYTDVIRYDPAELKEPPFVLKIHSIPPVFADKTSIECTLTIEEVDEAHCRQTLEGEVNINVLGLGFIAERVICSSLKDVYSGIPDIVHRWNAFRDEVLRQPDGRERLFEGRPPLKEGWVSEQVSQVMRAPYGSHAEANSSPALPRSTAQPDVGVAPAAADEGVRQNGGARQDGGGGGSAQAAPASPTANGAYFQQQQQQLQLQQAGGQLQQAARHKQRPWPVEADQGERAAWEDLREKSIAVFEGDTFFTPDDIPGGVDDVTAANLYSDQQEAADWFRLNSQGLQQTNSIAVVAAPSETARPEAQQWWKQEPSPKAANQPSAPAAAAAELGEPPMGRTSAGDHVMRSNISNVQNLLDWSDYWKQMNVAKQQPAPAAAHRLTGLYGIAVRRGLEQPTTGPITKPAAAGQPQLVAARGVPNEGGLPGPPWSESALQTPQAQPHSSRRPGKSVAFESPLVNGIHEARPEASEADTEDIHPSKFCFCFSRLGKPRSQYQ